MSRAGIDSIVSIDVVALIVLSVAFFITVVVIERRLAVREFRRLLLATEETFRAELARHRGEYAREFLTLREDNARALQRIEATIDRRLAAFIEELLEVSETADRQASRPPESEA